MLEEIIKKFNIKGELVKIENENSGNINNTYIASFKLLNGNIQKYLIQKINTTVFKEPYKLMANITSVTNYLKKQIITDDNHQVLEIIKTKDGKPLCSIKNTNGELEYYRIYNYINDAVSYNSSTDLDVVFNVGKAFGNFSRLLVNYPMPELEETIKDFHNTEKRFQDFIKDIKIDAEARALDVAREIVFILKRYDICSTIVNKLGTEEVPYRVTHNDTKVNNVLMHKDTKDFMAVIDLDTVMPGSMLFDYGDGIRSTSASCSENETDLNKVFLRLDLFERYTDGYLSEMAPYLTDTEVSLMGESIRIITLELAMRFLNDYINGDTYFKIKYKHHNLDRARTQIKLVEDIETKMDEINSYIMNSYHKYKKDSNV